MCDQTSLKFVLHCDVTSAQSLNICLAPSQSFGHGSDKHMGMHSLIPDARRPAARCMSSGAPRTRAPPPCYDVTLGKVCGTKSCGWHLDMERCGCRGNVHVNSSPGVVHLRPHVRGSRVKRLNRGSSPRHSNKLPLPLDFDKTLGFPGEGPEAQQDVDEAYVTIASANVTAWTSFRESDMYRNYPAEVWCLQEHKCHTKQAVRKAAEWSLQQGFNSFFAKAGTTAKGYATCGVAVTWSRHLQAVDAASQGIRMPGSWEHRLCMQPVQIGEVKVMVVSVYGNCSDICETADIWEVVAKTCQAIPFPVIVGGDWNAEPHVMQAVVNEQGAGWHVAAPGTWTCKPQIDSEEGGSCIDFFIVNNVARNIVAEVKAVLTPLRTHKVVQLSLQVKGLVPVWKWQRVKNLPVVKVVGPHWEVASMEKKSAQVERCRGLVIALAADDFKVSNKWEKLAAVDTAWSAWCELARLEYASLTGQDAEKAGGGFTYEEVDLVKLAARPSKPISGSTVQDEGTAAAWVLSRLYEAHAYASNEKQEWSPKTWRTACELRQFFPGINRGSSIEILEDPSRHHKEYIWTHCIEYADSYQQLKEKRRSASLAKWRERLAEQAEKGRREAFRFLKKADEAETDLATFEGTKQVLDTNHAMWSQLWQCKEYKCAAAEDFVQATDVECQLQEADLRSAAMTFPPSTACTDGVPPRLVGKLSSILLQFLALMANAWVTSATWPSGEAKVHVTLIPKASGGQRPIALFKSMTRVVCKALSIAALRWLGANEVHQVNTSKGRRIGDGMWRAQMRVCLGQQDCAAEIMVDLAKAFEFVDRKKLSAECIACDYPRQVMAAALATYGFSRRLTFQGFVTEEVNPHRGVTAGSAFATGDLWLVMRSTMLAIFRQYPKAIFTIHVDDISYQVDGKESEVADEIVKVHREVESALQEKCGLVISTPKTVVLGSTQEIADRVAKAIGLEAGCTLCRKLGADYSLERGPTANKVKGPKVRVSQAGRKGRRGIGTKVKSCFLTREKRIKKAVNRASRLRFFTKARGKMFNMGVAPVALYGAEHQPWDEKQIQRLENVAVKAHRLNTVGVPTRMTKLLLPVESDMRFRIHFAAVERWSREVWACAFHPDKFLGAKRVPADNLSARELVGLSEVLKTAVKEGLTYSGPMGALIQSLEFFCIHVLSPTVWTIDGFGEVDLAEGTPAMLRHILVERQKIRDRQAFLTMTAQRQEAIACGDEAKDLQLQQVLEAPVNWEWVVDLIVRPGGKVKGLREVSCFLSAAAWGVVPTPVWMMLHGWQVEAVCQVCGRTCDLRHTIMGCEDDPVVLQRWKAVLTSKCSEPAMAEAEVPAGCIQEFLQGHRVRAGTVVFDPSLPTYLDGSAKYVGTKYAQAASAMVQLGRDGQERAWGMAMPEGYPRSAVSAEHMAVLLCMEVASSQPSLRDPEGCLVPPPKLELYVDCQAVVQALRWPESTVRDQFKFGGCYKHPHFKSFGIVHKVDAHKTKEHAMANGWLEHWKGNAAADEIAKAMRPTFVNEPDIAKDRARRKEVVALMSTVGKLWQALAQARKGVTSYQVKVARTREKKKPHLPVLTDQGWQCCGCGKTCVVRNGVAIFDQDEPCIGHTKLRTVAHWSHDLHAALAGHDEVIYCSSCGAYGSKRARLLKEHCQGRESWKNVKCPNANSHTAALGRRRAQWTCLMVKHLHPHTKLPLRDRRRLGMQGRPPEVSEYVVKQLLTTLEVCTNLERAVQEAVLNGGEVTQCVDKYLQLLAPCPVYGSRCRKSPRATVIAAPGPCVPFAHVAPSCRASGQGPVSRPRHSANLKEFCSKGPLGKWTEFRKRKPHGIANMMMGRAWAGLTRCKVFAGCCS